MQFKVPSAATPIGLKDLLQGFHGLGNSKHLSFQKVFSEFIGVRDCYFVNSGTTAFYIILMALRHLSSKEEVVLPAYTAPSLLLPIQKAGLIPVLCDLSKYDYSFDLDSLQEVINENTLCVVPVYMFGIPWDVSEIITMLKGKEIFVIEDVASALGSRCQGQPLGSKGDVSFFSFNRGKNLTTGSGGCIITPWPRIASEIDHQIKNLLKKNPWASLAASTKLFALSLAVRPLFYTAFYPVICKFKYTQLHQHFESFQYTYFQAGVGASLFEKINEIFGARYNHGLFFWKAFKGLNGIIIPNISQNVYPVFNQFPVLVEDLTIREYLLDKLMKAGISVTTLYPKPIHKIYSVKNTAQKKDPFPSASYIAEHLLLIPTHPLMKRPVMQKIVEIFKNASF